MSIKSSIIIRPILSEKGKMLEDALNQYVFEVEKHSSSTESRVGAPYDDTYDGVALTTIIISTTF